MRGRPISIREISQEDYHRIAFQRNYPETKQSFCSFVEIKDTLSVSSGEDLAGIFRPYYSELNFLWASGYSNITDAKALTREQGRKIDFYKSAFKEAINRDGKLVAAFKAPLRWGRNGKDEFTFYRHRDSLILCRLSISTLNRERYEFTPSLSDAEGKIFGILDEDVDKDVKY